MAKKKHLLFAMTNPLPGRDAEYNRWYDEVAYPAYKSLPGLVPLGRFKAVDVPQMFPFQMRNQFEYISLYWFEAEDSVQFLEDMKAAYAKLTDYHFSEDIDQSRFCEPIFMALGDVNFAPLDHYEHLKL